MTAAPLSRQTRILLGALGALLTPVATGLSLAVIPFLAPFLLYLLVGAAFGYRHSRVGWRVGLWLILGLILVTAAVALVTTIGIAIVRRDVAGLGAAFRRDGFVGITLLFAGLPGAVGGCVGGNIGASVARLRGR